MPWQFFYTAVWQQAIHGQCAGEYWTYWEAGKGYNLNERAKSFDAMSQAARDLKRYAVGVTALANTKPKVAVLLSSAALSWAPKEHVYAETQAYKALNLSGIPVGFMTEEMLADKALSRYQLLVVPQAVHISKAMNNAINDFMAKGNTVVIVGDKPSADEYNKPILFDSRAIYWPDLKPVPQESASFDAAHPGSISPEDTNVKKLQVRLDSLLHQKGLHAPVQVTMDGKLPFGIEWRSVVVGGKRLVNICNYTNKPRMLSVSVDGRSFKGTNILDSSAVNGNIKLAPMQVMLLRDN